MEKWKTLIRDVVDFPKEGIIFKDITTLLSAPGALGEVVAEMKSYLEPMGVEAIIAAESRGFIFGAPLAIELGIPFIPVRKKGKLPAETVCHTYTLEYGEDTVCMHKDALKPGMKVAAIDDLLATGGTAQAMEELVDKLQAKVETHVFLIELAFLNGAEKLKAPVKSFLTY